MIRGRPLYGTLVFCASVIAACSSSSSSGGPQASAAANSGPMTPMPSFDPDPSMSSRARETCATPGPQYAFVNMEGRPPRPIPSSLDQWIEGLGALQGFWYTGRGVIADNPFLIGKGTHVTPGMPIFVDTVSVRPHDFLQLAIIPDFLPPGTGPNDDDAALTLQHIRLEDSHWAAVRAAQHNGVPPPELAAPQATAEATYQATIAPRLNNEVLGTNYDDSYYDNDSGDPNSKDPHNFTAICRYLQWQQYTLIRRHIYRVQPTPAGYQTTQAYLTHDNAPPAAHGVVNWVPVKEDTYYYRGYPGLAMSYFSDDNQNFGKTFAHKSIPMPPPLNWIYLSERDLTPVVTPSPNPSASPTPVPTGTFSYPQYAPTAVTIQPPATPAQPPPQPTMSPGKKQ